MYKAYGLPSLTDLLCAYPLSLLEPRHTGFSLAHAGRFPIVADELLATGKTLLGTTRTYPQAVALCKAWRLTDKQRTTVISIPSPRA